MSVHWKGTTPFQLHYITFFEVVNPLKFLVAPNFIIAKQNQGFLSRIFFKYFYLLYS